MSKTFAKPNCREKSYSIDNRFSWNFKNSFLLEDVQSHSILLVSRYQSHSLVFLVIQRTLYLRRQQRSKQFFLGISKAFLVLSFMDSTFPVTFLKLFCVKVSSCFVFQDLVEFSINYIKRFDAIICKLWKVKDTAFVLSTLLQIYSKFRINYIKCFHTVIYKLWEINDAAFVLPSLLQICSKLNDKSLLTERIIVYIKFDESVIPSTY